MQKQKRINWIDFVRGISAIMVMILHTYHYMVLHAVNELYPGLNANGDFEISRLHDLFAAKYPGSIMDHLGQWFFGYLDIGKIGVLLFFGVSGFVIPYSIKKYKTSALKNFIISRFFRLYPVYCLSIILAVLIGAFISDIIVIPPGISTFLINFTMFQKFFFVENIIGVYWTLQIELAFYILCGLYYYFKVLDNKKISFGTIIFMIITAFAFAIFRYFTKIEAPIAMPLALSIMFLSMLWRSFLFKEYEIKISSLIKVLAFLLIMLIPITYLGYNESFTRYLSTYYFAIAAFILFSTVFQIGNKFFVLMGKISYSVYLFHVLIGFIALKYMIKAGIFNYLGYDLGILVSMMVGIITTILFSMLTYYLIEEKFINIGKSIIENGIRSIIPFKSFLLDNKQEINN